MRLIFTLFVLFISLSALADDFNAWSAKCMHNGHSFQLDFKSKSGDASNQDMQASILTTKNEVKLLPIPESTYLSGHVNSEVKSICTPTDYKSRDGVAAFPVNDTNVLFFIAKDDRPSLEILVLALINIETGELLDFLDTDKNLKTGDPVRSFTVKQKDKKLNVRLVTEYMENTESDSIDNFIESWVEINVLSNKISLKY